MVAPVGSTLRRTAVLSSGPDVAAGPVANSGVGRSLEAGCRDLLQLVVRRLASSGYTEVGEGARHGRFSSKKGVRNVIIPTRADPHALAQWRRPMDIMSQGWSIRRLHASQQ